MNPIFHAAKDAHDLGGLGAAMTVAFFVCFLGWTWWAYRPAHREQMEAYGRIPLEEDGEQP